MHNGDPHTQLRNARVPRDRNGFMRQARPHEMAGYPGWMREQIPLVTPPRTAANPWPQFHTQDEFNESSILHGIPQEQIQSTLRAIPFLDVRRAEQLRAAQWRARHNFNVNAEIADEATRNHTNNPAYTTNADYQDFQDTRNDRQTRQRLAAQLRELSQQHYTREATHTRPLMSDWLRIRQHENPRERTRSRHELVRRYSETEPESDSDPESDLGPLVSDARSNPGWRILQLRRERAIRGDS